MSMSDCAKTIHCINLIITVQQHSHSKTFVLNKITVNACLFFLKLTLFIPIKLYYHRLSYNIRSKLTQSLAGTGSESICGTVGVQIFILIAHFF